jgi:hypothetical protein
MKNCKDGRLGFYHKFITGGKRKGAASLQPSDIIGVPGETLSKTFLGLIFRFIMVHKHIGNPKTSYCLLREKSVIAAYYPFIFTRFSATGNLNTPDTGAIFREVNSSQLPKKTVKICFSLSS